MGGCATKSAVVAAAPNVAAVTPEGKLAARKPRTGIFFVVHESLLSELEYEEQVDVYKEFLLHHPNHHPCAKGFVMIKLSREQITLQHARIRMSSYRWKNVEGVGSEGRWVIPANYSWFLDHIKQNRQIGWMDFLANVAVNVSVPEVIGYMGDLYANSITVGDWLLDMNNLAAALPRGWIFQETAFCELDPAAVSCLCRDMRSLGLQARSARTMEALQEYMQSCVLLTQLLIRRNFLQVYKASKVLTKIPLYGHADHLGFAAPEFEAAKEAIALESQFVGGTTQLVWFILLWMFSMEEGKTYDFKTNVMGMRLPDPISFDFSYAISEFAKVVTMPLVDDELTNFIDGYSVSLLSAYFLSVLTVEADRMTAITEVARALTLKHYKCDLSGEELLERAWKADSVRSGVLFSEVNVPITIGVPSLAFCGTGFAGTRLDCSPDWTTTCTSCHMGGSEKVHPTVLVWEYSTSDGQIETLKCCVKTGSPETGTGRIFYDAIKRFGLSGLTYVDGAPPDGKLRHASGCEVELFYCSEPGQLSLRKTGQTYLYVILAVKVDPDDPKVVAVASGSTCGNGVDGEKLPARDILL
eukprot:scaffold132979_cov63-Phaeocystis_antarctica.AAC.1